MEVPYISRGHGPRNAGNKSLVSFRAGYGVAGYVGHIPSSESIPVPCKEGPALRAGPAANRERAQARWSTGSLPFVAEPASMYQTTIGISSVVPNLHGPSRKAVTVGGSPNHKAGSPKSTRGSAVGGGGGEEVLVDTMPRNAPFVGKSLYAQTFGPPVPLAPMAFMPGLTRGKKPAFLQGTTYACTHENTAEMMMGIGWLDAIKNAPQPHLNPQWKEVIVQRVPEKPAYEHDYGGFGGGCVGVLPAAGEHDRMSLHGTTKDLFSGTTKAFVRMPGYQGFMPVSDRNPLCVAQATNDHVHPDPKDIRLFGLQQYLVEVPGTDIHKPREAANLMQGSKGRFGTETSFRNALLDSPERRLEIARKRATLENHGSTQATRKFFQWGTDSVSENGLKNAEAYYKLVRPYGGLPRISMPSISTEYGGKFSNKGVTR